MHTKHAQSQSSFSCGKKSSWKVSNLRIVFHNKNEDIFYCVFPEQYILQQASLFGQHFEGETP